MVIQPLRSIVMLISSSLIVSSFWTFYNELHIIIFKQSCFMYNPNRKTCLEKAFKEWCIHNKPNFKHVKSYQKTMGFITCTETKVLAMARIPRTLQLYCTHLRSYWRWTHIALGVLKRMRIDAQGHYWSMITGLCVIVKNFCTIHDITNDADSLF